MKTIEISASRSYTVTIGSGLLQRIGQTVAALTKAERVCIVSDSNVWPLYGEYVTESLCLCGFTVSNFVFPAGENSKNFSVYGQLLNFLAKNGISRGDCIVALGGGVVGDLAGFSAATYLRGIAYIQVPATLLAMVDSSVGGKTAIDLPAGKNLCGAFYQPMAVLCDTDVLSSLDGGSFRDGCAEVIKYAVLFDPSLFALLEEAGLQFDREDVIARCVQWKRDVVALDEFDNGDRMALNLGHTIGHAIESCSGYTISHGKAVAIGMAIISRAAKCCDAERICALLAQFGLPVTTDYAVDTICHAALQDKKRCAGSIKLIVPEAIGRYTIVPTPMEQLQSFMQEGL